MEESGWLCQFYELGCLETTIAGAHALEFLESPMLLGCNQVLETLK